MKYDGTTLSLGIYSEPLLEAIDTAICEALLAAPLGMVAAFRLGHLTPYGVVRVADDGEGYIRIDIPHLLNGVPQLMPFPQDKQADESKLVSFIIDAVKNSRGIKRPRAKEKIIKLLKSGKMDRRESMPIQNPFVQELIKKRREELEKAAMEYFNKLTSLQFLLQSQDIEQDPFIKQGH